MCEEYLNAEPINADAIDDVDFGEAPLDEGGRYLAPDLNAEVYGPPIFLVGVTALCMLVVAALIFAFAMVSFSTPNRPSTSAARSGNSSPRSNDSSSPSFNAKISDGVNEQTDSPVAITATLAAAKQHWDNGNFESVIAICTAILSSDLGNARALYARGATQGLVRRSGSRELDHAR